MLFGPVVAESVKMAAILQLSQYCTFNRDSISTVITEPGQPVGSSSLELHSIRPLAIVFELPVNGCTEEPFDFFLHFSPSLVGSRTNQVFNFQTPYSIHNYYYYKSNQTILLFNTSFLNQNVRVRLKSIWVLIDKMMILFMIPLSSVNIQAYTCRIRTQ